MAKPPKKQESTQTKTDESQSGVVFNKEVELPQEDTTTVPVEPPTEAVKEESGESNTVVATNTEIVSTASVEPASDLQSITISSVGVVWDSKMPFHNWVIKVILASRAGLVFDRSMRIHTESPPFRIKMMGTAEQIAKYEGFLLRPAPKPTGEAVKVLVNYLSRYDFCKKLIELGKDGYFVAPDQIATRSPRFNVKLVKYTKPTTKSSEE